MMNRAWVFLIKALLWLRYRVTIRGVKAVAAKGRRGVLFLPNHPALIDPVILTSRLYGSFRVRPLAYRDQIDRPFVRYLTRRINVLPIPDLSVSGAATGDEVRRVVSDCVEALRRGDNLIVYPAGRIYRGRLEDLGGASAVETILRELPDIRVVLVRTRGLWGSSFGWASGKAPDVAKALIRGLKRLLASGLLFAPRRPVSIELVEPDDLPRTAGRGELNRYLEAFYNRGALPNLYAPYTIWEPRKLRRMPEPTPPRVAGDPRSAPPATRKLVVDYLQDLTDCDPSVPDSARLAHDLGMDSLARADLLLWLQSEFGFPTGDVESVRTVGDVILAACGVPTSAAVKAVTAPSKTWNAKALQPKRSPALGSMTIPEAFLAQAWRSPDAPIMADQQSGVKTYRDVITSILALQDAIGNLPGENVGVMMPASVPAAVLYLATLFAGKTPVMVNWTAGRKNVLHGLDAVGVDAVLTARALLGKLSGQGVELGEVAERFVFIEDMAAGLTRRGKLAAWFRGRFTWRRLTDAKVSPTAAILFTSGSESLPKVVPLTHRNMLTNVADCWERFDAGSADSFLGILPPFHSFGLTATVLLSTCLGIRAAFYPNPTDAGSLGQMIDAYQSTILVGTPTFLHGIVRASTAEQLRSLGLVVSGAEKCPHRVYEALTKRCPQTVVIEGYGVTECSPVIAVNNSADPRPGTIGKVVRSLKYAVVDPETNSRVPIGSRGMLLVRGPSVFDGYRDHDGPSPFVEFEQRQWYRTGDLVTEDADGVLTFAGRLKRFVKLGGEMISLPAVETVLAACYDPDPVEGPGLAVAATDDEERPELVLFATSDIDREDANRTIREAGLSPLHNIRRVMRVDEMPLLGTGKTDYRRLAAVLAGDSEIQEGCS